VHTRHTGVTCWGRSPRLMTFGNLPFFSNRRLKRESWWLVVLYFMGNSPSWEANSRVAGQDVSSIYEIVFTKTHHVSALVPGPNKFIPLHPNLRFFFLWFQKGYRTSKILQAFLVIPVQAIFPAHLILVYLIICVIFAKEWGCKLWTPMLGTFFRALLNPSYQGRYKINVSSSFSESV
jgi:hypothetical protein